MNDDIRVILNRIAADIATEADLETLRDAIQTGQITVVTGERAVTAGGHITDTVIVTGDGNVVSVLQGTRGENIKAIMQEALSGELLAPPEPGNSPYKGLDFYDVPDAPFFFGREKLTAKLIAALRDHTFLAIVGDSGSGKSSLAHAGVIAVLQGRAPRCLTGSVQPPLGSGNWLYVTIRPTAYPLEALARGIAGEGAEAKTLLAALRISQGALREYVGTLLHKTEHVFLLVDQLEEIFTLCRNEQERASFVGALVEACRKEKDAAPCTVVVTLRADFYQQCLKDATLREILPSGQFNIGAMSRDDLKRAIQSPAELGGWVFQQSLVDQILADAGDEPGNLPLVSYAMLETWRQRSGRVMTLDGYYRAGRVQQAISQTADRVYTELEQEGLSDAARRICLALVTPGERDGVTRRSELVQTLAPGGPESPAGKALKILSDPDARLVIVEQQEVRLVHDALITAWPRLREWLAINQEELHRADDLRTAAAAWDKATEAQRSEFLAHRGGRLRDAERLAAGDNIPLGESVRTYLSTCREAESTRLRVRRRLAIGAIVVVSVLGLLAAWFSVQSNRNAQLAVAKQLAAASKTAAQDRRMDLALLLGVEAYLRSQTVESRSSLFAAIESYPKLKKYLYPTCSNEEPPQLAFSPDEKQLASGGSNGNVTLWSTEDGAYAGELVAGDPALPQVPPTLSVPSLLQFDASGNQLVYLHNLRISGWDLAAPDHAMQSEELPIPARDFQLIATSPDWTRIAGGRTDVWGGPYHVDIWSLASGKLETHAFTNLDLSPASEIYDGLSSLALSRDGKTLMLGVTNVGATGSGKVVFWDIEKRTEISPTLQVFTTSQPYWIDCMAVGDDSLYAIDATGYHSADRSRPRNMIIRADSGLATGIFSGGCPVAVSPSGRHLAFGDFSLWDLEQESHLGRQLNLATDRNLYEVTDSSWEFEDPDDLGFSADGEYLIAVHGTAKTMWRMATGQRADSLTAIAPKRTTDRFGHEVTDTEKGIKYIAREAPDTIEILDLATNQLIGAMRTRSGNLALSADGKHLVSYGFPSHAYIPHPAYLWNVDMDSWPVIACQIANRNLTKEEWDTFLPGYPYRKTCDEVLNIQLPSKTCS